MSDQDDNQRAFHLQCAKDLFNHTWTLLETPGRSREQDDDMMHAAHASRYHWSVVGEPVHRARGEWQLSRVYAVLGRAEPALHHGRRCLELCETHALSPFDHAFAHEALARAEAVAGDADAAGTHLEAARTTAESIADEEIRGHLLNELKTVPGFE
jgi:hypothetical protein